MLQSLFRLTKSRSTVPREATQGEGAHAPVVVVPAAPPPSFSVDIRSHARRVRSLQSRSSCSSRAVSPHSPRCATPSVRRASHPYADASPDDDGADTINTLMGVLLNRPYTTTSQPQRPRSSTTSTPPPPLVTATQETGRLDETGDLSLQDRTRPFIGISHSVLSVATTDPLSTSFEIEAVQRLLDREARQRCAVLAAETHCWSSLSRTLRYVCDQMRIDSTRLRATPLSRTTVLSARARSPFPVVPCRDLRAGTSAGHHHPYGGEAPPPLPLPLPLPPLQQQALSSSTSSSFTPRPFLSVLPLNTSTVSRPKHTRDDRHAQSFSPSPPRQRTRGPLVSPPRTESARPRHLLLSPPEPPLLPPSSPTTSNVLHEDECAVAWIPVTRDARGQLCVAWRAWDTAASAAASAAASPSASSLLCSWRVPRPGFDEDEREPIVEVSALTARDDRVRTPPPPPPPPPQEPHRRRSSITVLAYHAGDSPPHSRRHDDADDSHGTVLRIDESDVSALDQTETERHAWKERDWLDAERLSSLLVQVHTTPPPPSPRSATRYYHGAVIHSL